MTTRLQPGDRFAGHQILYALGTGAQAEVYAALDPSGERCALKLLDTDEGLDAKEHARLAQAAALLSIILHPSVVTLRDAGTWNDRVWVSLELIDGETLRSKIYGNGRRPSLEDVLRWLHQACAGIAAAHQLNVIHRDLSPNNILITRDNGVQVIDFGLPKLQGCGVKTTHEQRIGTARYMAPAKAPPRRPPPPRPQYKPPFETPVAKNRIFGSEQ